MLSIILDMLFLLAFTMLCFCFDISMSSLFFVHSKIFHSYSTVFTILFPLSKSSFWCFFEGNRQLYSVQSPLFVLYLNAICIDIYLIFYFFLYCTIVLQPVIVIPTLLTLSSISQLLIKIVISINFLIIFYISSDSFCFLWQ